MKKKFKLGVIGGGFMAQAIISGVIKSKTLNKKQIAISDVNETIIQKFTKNGIMAISSNEYILQNCEFVLFAVKPQSLNEVIKLQNNFNNLKLISIMAGIKKDRLKELFPNSLVARAMPNTPCSLGLGAVGLDLSDYAENNDRIFIENIFNSLAKVVVVPEEKLNAVTGISGSSPAYFYLFIKALVDVGVKNGLTYDEAKVLATATMKGSAEMIFANTDKSLDELINAVCSKGGTTIQAVNCFNENKLDSIVNDAVSACIKRAGELENS